MEEIKKIDNPDVLESEEDLREKKARERGEKSKLKRNWICPSCRHQTYIRKLCPACDTLMLPIEYDAKMTDGTIERKSLRSVAW